MPHAQVPYRGRPPPGEPRHREQRRPSTSAANLRAPSVADLRSRRRSGPILIRQRRDANVSAEQRGEVRRLFMISWLAIALSVLVVVSSPFSPTHLLQESDPPILRPASDDGVCRLGPERGLGPDRSAPTEPLHVCVLCKNFNGRPHVGLDLRPLFTFAATDALSRSRERQFPGFLRVSRSPPPRS